MCKLQHISLCQSQQKPFGLVLSPADMSCLLLHLSQQHTYMRSCKSMHFPLSEQYTLPTYTYIVSKGIAVSFSVTSSSDVLMLQQMYCSAQSIVTVAKHKSYMSS